MINKAEKAKKANMVKHKFILEAYKGPGSRHTCPGCNQQKKFTRYLDTETGEYLAHHVGKCDRIDKCSYHYTPSQFFQDNPEAKERQKEAWKHSEAWKTRYQAPKEQPVQYLPWDILNKTLADYPQNNFVRFLVSLFGEEQAFNLAQKYKLGTSKKYQNNEGKAVVFWQIDINGNIHQAKVMAYHPETGKRLKEEGKSFVSFMGKNILGDQNANLQQCFFGEHLLKENTGLPVALVESEKTAVLMAGYEPRAVWLATGGKNGAKWTERKVFQALEGRKVIIYPDLGAFNEWKEKAKILGTVCSYAVSDLIEQKAQGSDWEEGFDIADYFLKPQAQKPEQAQETPSENILPEGFTFFGKTLEFQGLPMGMLNEEELAEAHTKLKGKELEVMKKLNPAVGLLVDRFNLQIEAVEHHLPQEEKAFVLNINTQKQEVEQLKKLGKFVYCGRGKGGKVSDQGQGFWGNPFEVTKDRTREESIRLYKAWLHGMPEAEEQLKKLGLEELIGKGKERLKRIAELKGKTLGCFCKPKACHCDYLAQLASSS